MSEQRGEGTVYVTRPMARSPDADPQRRALPRVEFTGRDGRPRVCTWTGFAVRPLCAALFMAGRCTIYRPPLAIARDLPDGRTVVYFGGF